MCPNKNTYDTLIVGSGSAGAILATRLSEDPNRSVLLIEAGPDYPKFDEIPNEVKYGYARRETSANWGHTRTPVSDYKWNFMETTTETYRRNLKIYGQNILLNIKIGLCLVLK